MSFVDALRAVNSLKDLGLIDDYAVAGAMAIVFWTEPVPTYDLDVLVVLPRQPGQPVSLDSIYRWAAQQGYPATEEPIDFPTRRSGRQSRRSTRGRVCVSSRPST